MTASCWAILVARREWALRRTTVLRASELWPVRTMSLWPAPPAVDDRVVDRLESGKRSPILAT